MALGSTISWPSNPVFGLLSLTANQTKPLTDAAFSCTTAAPNDCRGFEVKVRSGSVKLLDKEDATDGWTLTAAGFGDSVASSLEGWWIKETAGTNATVEILCRTGGPS